MRKPRKEGSKQEIKLGKLELVFEQNFERDWGGVLASFIFHQIKDELDREVSSHR